jgi:hypothetical protein
MNDIRDIMNDLIRDTNSLGQSLPITRTTLKDVERAVEADLANMLKNVSGNYQEVKHASVVFTNLTGKQYPVTDHSFQIVGVFGPFMNSAIGYVAMERQRNPKATFRILELFEGTFQSYYEYPPVEAEAEKIAA